MKTGLPESESTNGLGRSLRTIRDTWGIPREDMAGIVRESWLEWGLGTEEDTVPRPPEVDMLAAHDATTTTPRKSNNS